MKIVYLIETAAEIWGGVKIALDGANLLTDRGHQVTVVSKSPAPTWMTLRCAFQQVNQFDAASIPTADVVIATFWTTVPAAIQCGKGIPVHYVQGYEGEKLENAELRSKIEAVYQLPGTHKITISPHLSQLMRERFACESTEICYMVDHDNLQPGPARSQAQKPVRVGLVGPYQIDWKDIPTGLAACALAKEAGMDLQVVRITNTTPHPAEQNLPFPVEWHVQVPPEKMGELYRSMDVFLGTSRGSEEGFFLPAVEAMACGVPCVLTDIPCFRGYGTGQYALFVPPKSPMDMAEAMVMASCHPAVSQDLRRIGLQVASKYTQQNHINDLEQCLQEILATHLPKHSPATPTTSETSATPQPNDIDLNELSQGIVQALRQASDLYLAQGQYGEAVQHLRACLELQAKNENEIRAQLAYALYLAGNDKEALQIYDALQAAGTHSPEIKASRAMVLFTTQRHAEAAAAFEEALDLGGESAELVNNLGVAYFHSQNHESAKQCFQRALVLQPDYTEAKENLLKLQHG